MQIKNPMFSKKVLRGLVTSGTETRQGKTSIARHGLKPFLQAIGYEVDFLAVESATHAQGVETKLYKPRDLAELATDLRFLRPTIPGGRRCALVDLGGDYFTALMEEMRQVEGGGVSFDFAVFPVTAVTSVPKFKTMLHELDDAGLQPEQIYLIFNKIDRAWLADSQGFDGIFKHSKQLAEIYGFAQLAGLNVSKAFLPDSQIISRIMDFEADSDSVRRPEFESIFTLAHSEIDYEALANDAIDAGDEKTTKLMATLLHYKGMAAKSVRDYQKAIQTMFSVPEAITAE
jgi:hypothetical protein